VEILDGVEAARDEIWQLALGEKRVSKAATKDRRAGLRIVDAIQPGDGERHETAPPIAQKAEPPTSRRSRQTAGAVNKSGAGLRFRAGFAASWG